MAEPVKSEPMMRSPLHAFDLVAKARSIDESKGAWANEVTSLAFVSLRGDAADMGFTQGVASVMGVALPTRPCTFTRSTWAKILWLSPDEWMIVCPRSRLAALLRDLTQALSGIRSQVVDNSGGYTQVLLLGKNACDVLAHASVYNISSLQQGRVVGTTFGKASLYVHCEGDAYCLVLRRSFADYIWQYLERAAAPYGFGVAKLEIDGIGGERGAA